MTRFENDAASVGYHHHNIQRSKCAFREIPITENFYVLRNVKPIASW